MRLFDWLSAHFLNHTILWQKQSQGLITVERYRKEDKLVIKRNHKTLSGIYLTTLEPTSQLYWFPHLPDLFPHRPRKILSLGGGACVYPTQIIKGNRLAFIDVVEIDPAVIEAAKKFFTLPSSARLQLQQGDGYERLLHTAAASYDFIFVDVGITLTRQQPNYNSQFLNTATFGQYCRILKKHGTLMFNIMTTLSKQDKQYVSKQLKVFTTYFPTHLVFQVTQGETNTNIQDVVHVFSMQHLSIKDLKNTLKTKSRKLTIAKAKYQYVLNNLISKA